MSGILLKSTQVKIRMGGGGGGRVNHAVWKIIPSVDFFYTTFFMSTGDLGIPLGVEKAFESPAEGMWKEGLKCLSFVESRATCCMSFP